MEFKELVEGFLQQNVNDMTEEKNGLTYLSWAKAWQEVLKADPHATYDIERFNGLPYCGEGEVGYMVFTRVTILGETKGMQLPVMDNVNNPLKAHPYTYKVKKYEWDEVKHKKVATGWEEKSVEPITMFDVNKAIMRCLAKNIALFGLGLYIYTGEDLPIEIEKPITEEQKAEFAKLEVNTANVLLKFNINSVDELTEKQASAIIEAKRNFLERSTK